MNELVQAKDLKKGDQFWVAGILNQVLSITFQYGWVVVKWTAMNSKNPSYGTAHFDPLGSVVLEPK